MFDLPLHPAIVHIPLGVAVVVPLLALGVLAHGWAKGIGSALWATVVATQLVVVGGAFAAAASGERDEDRVEQTVGEAAVEAHEEWAARFQGIAVASLLSGAAALAFRRRETRRALATLSFACSVATLGVGVAVGHSGGRLVFGEGGASQSSLDTEVH